MEKPFFSILIAAYNVAPYIDHCLMSIRSQTFKNFEAIVIDDCSTDNTLALCKDFSNKDHRFKIIKHHKNLGLLSARKTAVNEANGEFILFVDGDDSLADPTVLNELHKKVTSIDSDIYRFNIKTNGSNKKQIKKWNKALNRKTQTRKSSLEILSDYFETRAHSWNLWACCYKATLIKTAYSKVVNEYFNSCEDGYTSFIIASYANSYVHIDTPPIYAYTIGTGMSTQKISIDSLVKSSREYDCIKWLHKFIEESNFPNKEKHLHFLNCFEEHLAKLFVDRLLSLDSIDLNRLLKSKEKLPCSNTILSQIIIKSQKKAIENLPNVILTKITSLLK